MFHTPALRIAAAACLLMAASCSDESTTTAPVDTGSDSTADAGEAAVAGIGLVEFQGKWIGSWGGGESGDGVVFLPVVAELVIEGDTVQLSRFPDVNDLSGTIQIHVDAQKVIVTPDAEHGEDVELMYKLSGDALTLTVADGRTVSLTRKRPQAEVTESDDVPLP